MAADFLALLYVIEMKADLKIPLVRRAAKPDMIRILQGFRHHLAFQQMHQSISRLRNRRISHLVSSFQSSAKSGIWVFSL